MELTKKLELAQAVNELVEKNLCTIWQGFKPVPFILYDDKHQVAVGSNWSMRYSKVSENLFMAKGCDEKLMGNTALNYEGRMIAIWDTRTWSDDVETTKAATGIAHEMFHAFQLTDLNLAWANELLLPQYKHSVLSTALVIEENNCLIKILSNCDALSVRESLENIAWLRAQREKEIGKDYMNYDMCVENIEGTATFVETKMKAVLTGRTAAESASVYLPQLSQNQKLLNNYRHRCYAAGLILCLAADVLCEDWQTEWQKTNMPLFSWIKEKLDLKEKQLNINQSSLSEGKTLVEKFASEKQEKIAEFAKKPLVCLEGEIGLLLFDPMNLVCSSNLCLHLHGQIRLGEKEFYIQTAFLEEFDGTILNAKRLWLTNEVAVTATGFIVEGLGEFAGTIKQSPGGLSCIVTKRI